MNTQTIETPSRKVRNVTPRPETKAARRARLLLAHYASCERLARECGHTAPNGKKISTQLLALEREAHNAATAQCNGEAYNGQPFRLDYDPATGAEVEESEWDRYCDSVRARLTTILDGCPPSFRYNQDPRGYALKLDPTRPGGADLIHKAGLQTDWGGYGILSPEIA